MENQNQDIFSYLAQKGLQLVPQQQAAVQTLDGPVLLLAVPGAGKTTVMVARIANLIRSGRAAPSEILTLTFSRASAADMAERYRRLFGELGGEEPAFCTIHSLCYRILRHYCRMTGGQLPELLEPGEKSRILRQLYRQIAGEFLSDDLEEELTNLLGYIKNAMLTQQQAQELDCQIKELWAVKTAFEEQKKQLGKMDFDDMLSYAWTALRKYPALRERWRAQYRYLCVDEAQDTSRLQHQIIQLLAAPDNNLFLVGDEDQSIYRFRGACPQHLLDFPRQYPGAAVLKLEENFRSTRSIVDRANIFIAQNRDRFPKQMFSRREAGEPIQTPQLRNLKDQYRLVIDTYLKEPGTMAVIYRNHYSAIPLCDILERNDLDFCVKDHKTSFRANYVIGDVLAFLDLSFDPQNLAAFHRVFYKTSARVRRSALAEMDTQTPLGQGEGWFDRLLEQQEERRSTGKLRFVADAIARLRNQKPDKAIESILYTIGYLDYLEYASGNAFSGQAQKLGALRSLASRTGSIEELLGRLDEMDQIIAFHSQQTHCRLTLTTAHSAKGLEFDTVVVLDAVEDIFPTHSAADKLKTGSREEMEEEARLFYVACTRARHRLILPVSSRSEDMPVLPSRFIARLTEDKVTPEKSSPGKVTLYPGLDIVHRIFGPGQVMQVDREKGTFTAYFGKNGTRTLSMKVLEEDRDLVTAAPDRS